MNTENEKTYDNYFGRCPECGGTNGFLNIGRAHIFICDEHKLAWFAGENLFRCWKDETEEDWKKNKEILSGYRIVDGDFDY